MLLLLLLLLSSLPVRHCKAYTKGPSLYKVLTYSQGTYKLRELKTTNRTGQIIYRKKTYSNVKLLKTFLVTEPYSNSVEINQLDFKLAFNSAIYDTTYSTESLYISKPSPVSVIANLEANQLCKCLYNCAIFAN